MRTIDGGIAKSALLLLADHYPFELVWPSDPRRSILLHELAAANALAGTDWSYDAAVQSLTVTLPGAGEAASHLNEITCAGPTLYQLACVRDKPCVYLSLDAQSSGLEISVAVSRALVQIGQIQGGSLGWCADYGVPYRDARDATTCGTVLAALIRLGGATVEEAHAEVLRRASALGLEQGVIDSTKAVLASVEATIRAIGIERVSWHTGVVYNELVKQGWSPAA